MSRTIQLLEFTQVVKARAVDEEQGILYDLVALGPTSANGRDYPEATMHKALPLFEGKQSFANHMKRPGDEPSIYDVLGVWKECRVEGGKVRGNFHYFKAHPFAGQLVEAAKRPELAGAFGFSINAQGELRRENGRDVVSALEELSSIDCVSRPATTSGIAESRGQTMRSTVKQIIEALRYTRPDYARGLTEQAEAGIMSGDTAMDMPAEAPAAGGEADHETALKAGFRAAVMAIMDDESLDTAAKLKKMRDVLRAEEKLIGGGSTDTGAGAGEGEGEGEAMPAEESRKLRLENTGLKLLVEAGVRPSKVLTRALAGCATEVEMKELLEEYRAGGSGRAQPPRSAAPPARSAEGNGQRLQEQRGGQGQEIPAETKQLARWLSTRD